MAASGFTLIFGLLRIVNLAHGSLYLFGGDIGYAIASQTGSFLLGGVALMGLALDQDLLRFVRGFELRQVLATLGAAFALVRPAGMRTGRRRRISLYLKHSPG